MTVERHRIFASVVVYAHNSADATRDFVVEVDRALEDHFEHHEIIVVDDASTDETSRIVGRDLAITGTLTYLRMARHHGSEAAMHAGLARATGDWIFDVSSVHRDWELLLLLKMFEMASLGSDITAATTGRASRARRGIFALLNRFGSIEMQPGNEPVRLVSRRALNAILDMGERVRYRRALYALTGYPRATMVYMPVSSPDSKDQRFEITRAFDAVISCSDIGLRLSYVLALIFAAVSFCIGIYAIAAFTLLPDVAKGWTTLMLLVSGGLTALFLVVALLGEYTARILVEVRDRPNYSVSDAIVHHPSSPGDSPPLARAADQSWKPPGPAPT